MRLGWSLVRRPADAWLAAGYRVASWQRCLAAATGRWPDAGRLAGWVLVLRSPRPALTHGPLLGHALAELTEPAERAGGKPAAAPHHRRPAPPAPSAERHAGATVAPPALPVSPAPVARPPAVPAGPPPAAAAVTPPAVAAAGRLAREADAALLTRLAGRLPVGAMPGRPAPHRIDLGPLPERDARFVPGRVVPDPERTPPAGKVHNWRAELARRAASRWLPEGPASVAPAAGRVVQSPAAIVPVMPQAPAVPVERAAAEAAIAQAWAAPVAGVSAPHELLAQLAGLDAGIRVATAATAETAQRRRAERGRDWPEPGTPAAARVATLAPAPGERIAVIGPAMPEDAAEPAALGRRWWPAPLLSRQRPAAAEFVPAAEAEAAGHAPEPGILARPGLLPVLAPPPPGGPTAPALAAVRRYEEAAGEPATEDDELDALAQKFQRILDREARRHGIDV